MEIPSNLITECFRVINDASFSERILNAEEFKYLFSIFREELCLNQIIRGAIFSENEYGGNTGFDYVNGTVYLNFEKARIKVNNSGILSKVTSEYEKYFLANLLLVRELILEMFSKVMRIKASVEDTSSVSSVMQLMSTDLMPFCDGNYMSLGIDSEEKFFEKIIKYKSWHDSMVTRFQGKFPLERASFLESLSGALDISECIYDDNISKIIKEMYNSMLISGYDINDPSIYPFLPIYKMFYLYLTPLFIKFGSTFESLTDKEKVKLGLYLGDNNPSGIMGL